MKTIIFDIDGTITNMWPIEKSILLCLFGPENEKEINKEYKLGIRDTYLIFKKIKKQNISKKRYYQIYNQAFVKLKGENNLPKIKKYPIVDWIIKNKKKYNFVYATGGQQLETEYILKRLKIIKFFDLENSISKSNYPFTKKTGLPFLKIKSKFSDCIIIADGKNDLIGAQKAKIPIILLGEGREFLIGQTGEFV